MAVGQFWHAILSLETRRSYAPMMHATEFEFRQRWSLFGSIFFVGFILFAVDHVPVWVRLSAQLSEAAKLPMQLAEHLVLGVASAIMIASALIRVWGSAYLGREVVHDHALHSEALRADGPYRHTRNPLYFGNVLMSVAMGLFAPAMGFPIIAIGIPLFCYRLIGREEAGLEAEQGEAYRAFKRAVPRMWPALRAQIPAGGATPDWISGLSAEVFFLSFAAGVIAVAITLNPLWLWIGCLASPLLSWLAELAMRKGGRAVPTESKE
jgi:protein-S-isoprenylcysteine O-methyltransferase Ste14